MNVAPPVDYNDATTKKYLADLLKTKAGTTYVSNELAKKPINRLSVIML